MRIENLAGVTPLLMAVDSGDARTARLLINRAVSNKDLEYLLHDPRISACAMRHWNPNTRLLSKKLYKDCSVQHLAVGLLLAYCWLSSAERRTVHWLVCGGAGGSEGSVHRNSSVQPSTCVVFIVSWASFPVSAYSQSQHVAGRSQRSIGVALVCYLGVASAHQDCWDDSRDSSHTRSSGPQWPDCNAPLCDVW